MDIEVIMSLFPSILSLLIIAISLFLCFFFFRKTNANVPPGSSGWPVVGESIRFLLSGPQKFIEERTKKYSEDVFQTSLFGQKLAVLCGPQGNKFIFANDTKLLASWWPLSLRKVLFFPEFVQATSDEVTALTHDFMHDILKPEALKQYIPVMDSMAREHVEVEWVGNEVVKVFPVSKKYTFDLACRLFMSVVDVDHVTRLAEQFALIASGLFSVPIDLPGTAYRRAIKGGKLKHKANVPPGSSGLPVVGESIKFVLSGPQGFIRERMEKYAQDVFQTSLFGQKMALFCGPQGNKFLFSNQTKSLASWWPLSVRKALFFPEVVESSTDKIASLQHSFMREILKPEALKHYIPVMDSMAREHVESEWAGHEVVKAYSVSKKYTFDLACKLLMSVDDAEHLIAELLRVENQFELSL
uniref:Cytochrome P450 n=1 Tax=Daucus carota subsp. sativus TaxID=79200 RepID=A0A164T8I2_DAUCS